MKQLPKIYIVIEDGTVADVYMDIAADVVVLEPDLLNDDLSDRCRTPFILGTDDLPASYRQIAASLNAHSAC